MKLIDIINEESKKNLEAIKERLIQLEKNDIVKKEDNKLNEKNYEIRQQLG